MNKKILLALLVIVSFGLTGCTKYMQYDNKTAVIDNTTGQRMVENILCQTDATNNTYESIKKQKTEEYNKKLEANEIKEDEYNKLIEELNNKFAASNAVNCSEFQISSGGYEGIWTSVFVKTLAFIIVKIGALTKNYGWAIVIVTILIRLIMYPVTKKTAMQSENMKKAQPKLQKLEQKYRNKNDQESLMLKNQEMLKIYKDYNINPFSGCLFALIQIPLFFAFYEALYRLPVVLEEKFLGINLGLTVGTALKNGQFYYIMITVLVALVTYYSFKLNSTANIASDQQKQMQTMTMFSVIMIGMSSFMVSIGIAIYWITNSGFTIIQNLLVKRSKKNDDVI